MNRKKSSYRLILLCIGMMWPILQGNAQSTEYESRFGVDLNLDLNDRWSAGLNLEQRFGPDFISYSRMLAEPEITCRLGESVDFSLTYRIAYDKDGQNYFFQHRWSPAISYAKELGDWRIKYTATAQYGSPDYDEVHGIEHFVLRNKLSLRYSIFGSRFRPELRAELFSGQQSGRFLNHQVRLMALTAYRLTRLSSLEFYVLIDREFNLPQPDRAFVLGLSYSHQLVFR